MVTGVSVATKMNDVNEKEIEKFYLEKYSFISELIKDLPWNQENADEEEKVKSSQLPDRLYPGRKKEGNRARTVEELQEKLATFKAKTKLRYKEKLVKQGLKNRIKKKDKKEKRKLLKKMNKKKKREETLNDVKPPIVSKQKPVYNSEGQIIYSKFDFSVNGTKNSEMKTIRDPISALKKVKKEEEKLKAMKDAGEIEKVQTIVDKKAWKEAIMKSEGAKIKDDPELLKQSIKKIKDRKKKSMQKWKDRENKLKSLQDLRQKKRKENIQTRQKQKKVAKLKKLAKRGKVIAGF